MTKMNEPDIASRMLAAKDWERLGDMLVRSWHFPSFRRSLEFVNQVAALAERLDYYPDIILSFRTVRLELSTHAVGGLTEGDFAFAAEVGSLPSDR
jgi:4a-hydroxytetrahydrobiopterin dehydratase